MIIHILASGSSGNVALVNYSFLIDCGKSFNWTLKKLNHKLPDAIIITHEHSDHVCAVRHFLQRAVDIFLTKGTADALGLPNRYNIHHFRAGEQFKLCGVDILPFNTFHDAAEPVGFILRQFGERVLYLTDSGKIPNFKGSFDKIFIEANYSTKTLLNSDTNRALKQRILNNHLSTEQVQSFLAQHSNAEVTLLHQSLIHL